MQGRSDSSKDQQIQEAASEKYHVHAGNACSFLAQDASLSIQQHSNTGGFVLIGVGGVLVLVLCLHGHPVPDRGQHATWWEAALPERMHCVPVPSRLFCKY